MEIKEGEIQILPAPRRGKRGTPYPDELVDKMIEGLSKIDKSQVVSTGRVFEKYSQAQTQAPRVVDAITQRDRSWVGKLGTSVISTNPDDEDKPMKEKEGPFVLAVRLD